MFKLTPVIREISHECACLAQKDNRPGIKIFFDAYNPDTEGKRTLIHYFTNGVFEFLNNEFDNSVRKEVYIELNRNLPFKKRIDIIVIGENGRVAIELKHNADFGALSAAIIEIALAKKHGDNFKRIEDFEIRNDLSTKYYIFSSYGKSPKNTYEKQTEILKKICYKCNNKSVEFANLIIFREDVMWDNGEIQSIENNEVFNNIYNNVKKHFDAIIKYCNYGP